jgi:hypothetical protein
MLHHILHQLLILQGMDTMIDPLHLQIPDGLPDILRTAFFTCFTTRIGRIGACETTPVVFQQTCCLESFPSCFYFSSRRRNFVAAFKNISASQSLKPLHHHGHSKLGLECPSAVFWAGNKFNSLKGATHNCSPCTIVNYICFCHLKGTLPTT